MINNLKLIMKLVSGQLHVLLLHMNQLWETINLRNM